MNAAIGHNGGPNIDLMIAIQAAHDDTFLEVSNWLDGAAVESQQQMVAVDALLSSVKGIEKEAEAAKEVEYRPHKAAGDAVIERWKPFLADLSMQRKGLVAITDSFKRKLAAEKAEASRLAQAAAWEATRKAQEAARLADAANIEQQREASAAMDAAKEAQRVAMAASKDKVSGMRTVTHHAVDDRKALLNAIAKDHRSDVDVFIDTWAQKNHKQFPNTPGLRVWTTKEAF